MSKDKTLHQIAAQIKACTACGLHQDRINPVPGIGAPHAKIMLIGDAPNFHEDEIGEPFIKESDRFLEEILGKIGVQWDELFITNVVKCRPLGNRDPLREEIETCGDYLDQQIELVNPQVIVTLGQNAMKRFLPNKKISTVHGQAVKMAGRNLFPVHHPATVQEQSKLKTEFIADFQKLQTLIAELPDADTQQAGASDHTKPKQLSLF